MRTSLIFMIVILMMIPLQYAADSAIWSGVILGLSVGLLIGQAVLTFKHHD